MHLMAICISSFVKCSDSLPMFLIGVLSFYSGLVVIYQITFEVFSHGLCLSSYFFHGVLDEYRILILMNSNFSFMVIVFCTQS